MKILEPSYGLAPFRQIRIGHWTDSSAMTGLTVVIFDSAAPCSVHVAGGAPGSQETDLLDPQCLVQGVDAIVLSGGSAFGLGAATGVRRYLEEQGRGFRAGLHKVPIVPAAVIFDLGVGDGSVRPGPEEAYMACQSAESGSSSRGANRRWRRGDSGKISGNGKKQALAASRRLA